MSVPDICSLTTTFSTQGAVPLRRLMSSTRACHVSPPSSPTGIVVAMRSLSFVPSPYILHPVRGPRKVGTPWRVDAGPTPRYNLRTSKGRGVLDTVLQLVLNGLAVGCIY